VGGAAAALTGLILVGMSLHLAEIRASEIQRARANVSLLTLASKVALAGVVHMPGQPRQLLGAEIFVFGSGSPTYSLSSAGRSDIPEEALTPKVGFEQSPGLAQLLFFCCPDRVSRWAGEVGSS
jgi:hypothetical protein